MKLTLVRSIPLTFVVAAVCFLLSGVSRFKDAHHGVDYVVGEIVWFGFLLSALTLVVLLAVIGYRAVSRRRAEAARA